MLKIKTEFMKNLTLEDTGRIIEMAWEDRTPFEAIYTQFGLTNNEVIKLMRSNLKESSFKMWRQRTQGRKTKHASFNVETEFTFRADNRRRK